MRRRTVGPPGGPVILRPGRDGRAERLSRPRQARSGRHWPASRATSGTV